MNRWLWTRIADQVSRGVGVVKTSSLGIKTKTFDDGGQKITALEQNPRTGSEWAAAARAGHKVVQFVDGSGKYLGVSVDGVIKKY